MKPNEKNKAYIAMLEAQLAKDEEEL